MAIDFPDNPQINEVFTSGTIEWIWTGSVWNLKQDQIDLQKRPIHKEYLTNESMILDQENQVMNFLYFDGQKYWVYIGTTNNNISDYRLLDPTVPEYVKEITEDDITNWNNKLDRILIEESNLISGNTYTIFSVEKTEYDSIFINYNIKDTITNAKKSGTLISTWDIITETITQKDFSTDDLNFSTENLEFNLNILDNNINFDVLVNSGNWSVKILVNLL